MNPVRKYKKSELTQYAKQCAKMSDNFMDHCLCAEELSRNEICREIVHAGNEELLLEISKRFAKYADCHGPWVNECASVADFYTFYELIKKIINCCEENGLFIY